MFKTKPQNPTNNSLSSPGEVVVNVRGVKYPFRLNFYHSPPTNEITLDEFECLALDRLRVLKAVEEAFIRKKVEADIRQHILQASKKYLPLDREKVGDVIDNSKRRLFNEQRRKDDISHFILRQAYCKTEELRAWFLRNETALFSARFEDEGKAYQQQFISYLNLDIKLVSKEEKVKYGGWLMKFHELRSVDELEAQTFYKVKFDSVLDLIGKRAVVVKDGYAFVAESQRSVLVVNAFKERLAKGLDAFDKVILDDDRLTKILESLAKQYMTQNSFGVSSSGDTINANDVDNLMRHFPACMRNLAIQLKDTGHLKHGGRMQYGLFLKAVGLPVEEALLYWRRAFRHISEDDFSKRYAYNIRHNYGMEGKRTNYTSYSCPKIIAGTPGSGEHHGCPYKHFSQDSLRSLVGLMGVSEAHSHEVLALAKNGHYQLACTRVFELTHAKPANSTVDADVSIESIMHPNQYFQLSYKGVNQNSTPSSNNNVGGMVTAKPEPDITDDDVMATEF